ncbi:MAG: bifunctional hydroxymethylpyrimidine kinase/phosphomethylpyrimidine kinase [Oscillospiraceae bacterium]|jgi:hydroxymethylpyrimidine/phosphomethylpyrimidine kinase|nr:bifunctional hydroxymethylpyrimidine kinase/phosphomethylpyrimidine kinase [Oscillospiraceae bacterium]
MFHPPIVLTVAGSDSSGGAGIQADLKTFAAHGCYGMSAVTALTAQNTRGVAAVHVPPADFLAAQLRSVLTDFPPDAVKIGVLPDEDSVLVVAEALRGGALRTGAPVVLDPVMVATSGAVLSDSGAAAATRRELFPLAALVTPNIPEAEALSGRKIASEADMEAAARKIGAPVLLKGGHLGGATDLLYVNGEAKWFRGEYFPCGEVHGTGCTLSSAVACRLAEGFPLPEAVRLAKDWLAGLLRERPDFGVPNGPLFHLNVGGKP